MNLRWNRIQPVRLLATIWMLLFATVSNAGVPQLDSIMDRDPVLPQLQVVRHVPSHWKPLWRAALTGPEEDLRREAAAAILREHQQGCPDVDDMNDALLQALAVSKNQATRMAIAEALIELDYRESAAPLFDVVLAGSTGESLVVEPALARWGYPPVFEVWLARLSDPQRTTLRLLRLAIDGIAIVEDTRGAESLRHLALDHGQTAEIRLAAGRSLGKLLSEGLADDARNLADDVSPRATVNRLVAASLLSMHSDGDAQAVLKQLAVDPQPAVAAISLRRLLQIDPEIVQPLVPDLLQSPDGAVRKLAAQSLVDRPRIEILGTLANLLDDTHPDVRGYARESLRELAKQSEFAAAIRERATAILNTQGWRGLEQAARLLGELDHKPAAGRLIELLYFERPEVHVTAAWSLSQLAVPETLPAMLEFTKSVTERFPANPGDGNIEPLTAGHDACLSHLFQAFGMMHFAEPEPILLKFVPRRYDLGPRSRGAAIWALGLLHENDPRPELMTLLGQRVADAGEIPYPEPVEVRANSATSLGRMNASAALRPLRHVYATELPGDRVREACGWAIAKITGEDLPELDPRLVSPPDAFLRPVDP